MIPEDIGTSGPIALRPTAAQIGRTPYFYWATDAATVAGGQTLYEVVLESGALGWKTVGGSSAAGGLPKYWVGKAGTVPVAPYNTIQSAIDAAKADGHNSATNPCTVFVLPGTYAENLTLADGVYIRCVQDGVQYESDVALWPAVLVTGSAAIVTAGAGENYRLTDIEILSTTASHALSISGTNGCSVYLARTVLFTTNAAARAINIAVAACLIGGDTCAIHAIGVGSSAIACALNYTEVSFNHSTIFSLPASTSVSLTGTGLFGVTNSDISGGLDLRGATAHTLIKTRVTATTVPALTLAAGTVITLDQCELSGTSTPVISGSGTVNQTATIYPQLSTISSTTVQTSKSSVQQFGSLNLTVGGGIATITDWEDLMRVDHAGAPLTLNLPDAGTVPKGARGVIKSINAGAANITVTRAGADTIDETLTTVVIASAKGFLELQCLGAGVGWQVVGKFL